MVRLQNGTDPSVIRRVRTRITIILWILLAGILLLNYRWVIELYHIIF